MSLEIEVAVERVFRRLSEHISEVVTVGLAEGSLSASTYAYTRDRLDEVKYTEHGLHRKKWGIEVFNKTSWREASEATLDRVRKTEEFKAASDSLNEASLSPHDVENLLEQFTKKLAYKFLETADPSERREYLEYLLSIVIKHFNCEPLSHSAEIQLEGVLISPEFIEFDAVGTKIHLRPVTEQDLLHEEMYSGFREMNREDPSAILNIEFSGNHENAHEIQGKVEQAVTILRLFKVGSVRYLSYITDSESLTDKFAAYGGVTDIYQHGGIGRYRIEDAEIPRLEEFWRQLCRLLPAAGYGRGTINVVSISVAYQRYWDAIFRIGGVERKISDAVMGLESLFLKGSEKQESVYRLRMRVAKVLALLGQDPYISKSVANDAYAIRSAFVHGDNVDKKVKRQVESRHGDFNNLFKSVLNQLRIAIVLMTILGHEKESFVALVDDSLIDTVRSSELQHLVAPVKSLL